MRKKILSTDLEKSLQELETLVNRMEQGDLSLEEALKDFERGVNLIRGCRQALNEAEQKVEILIGDKTESFNVDKPENNDHAPE